MKVTELNSQIDRVLKLFENDLQVNNRIFLSPDHRDISHDIVISKMLEFDLIKVVNDFGTNHTWELTPFGHKVLRYNGWTHYQQTILKKELNDAKISENLVRTKWWPHYFSGAAVVISIFSLIVSVKQCRQDEINSAVTDGQKNEQRIEPTMDSKSDTTSVLNKDSTARQR